MQTNSLFQNSVHYSTIKTKHLLAIASSNGLQTLALTDIKSTSEWLDFDELSSKYKIKPVLGIAFKNGGQTEFILIAKNKQGYKNINNYLSTCSQDSELKIPESAPELKDVFVIYPFLQENIYHLKENEFLGIQPKDLNHLKFSKWNSFRHKLVVLQTVSFQNKKNFKTHKLLRAIDNNTLLNKLAKIEDAQIKTRMLPYQELWNTYDELPEFLKNTTDFREESPADFDLLIQNQNTKHSDAYNKGLDFRLVKKTHYASLHHSTKSLGMA